MNESFISLQRADEFSSAFPFRSEDEWQSSSGRVWIDEVILQKDLILNLGNH